MIEFHGDIHTLSEQYLYRRISEAEELRPELLIVEVDSPGGDAEASLRMAERLRDLGWARTVAYVPRQALSGGAILALGCDEILIGPDALFGDAGPIFLDEDFLFRHASEKYRSHLVEQVRNLAQAKGRPPALAEAMVDMDVVVFQVKHRVTGEITFLSQEEVDSSANPDAWEKIQPVFESRAGHFLEVNGRRAVELQLANATVSSRAAVRQRLEPLDQWTELQWKTLDTVVLILNHPVVTGILFIVGLIALYIELAAPGLGLGGITALLCFTVFFWSRFLGGTAEWLEVLLFATGVVLLLIEIFVLPGFGIWGFSGVVLVLAALVLASQPFLVPETRQELHQLTRSLTITLISVVGFVILAAALTRRLGHIPVLRNLMLQPPGSTEELAAGTGPTTEVRVDGQWVRVGQQGRAETPLRPAGRIRLGDNYVDVVSDGAFVQRGQRVQVIDVRGNRIVVRQIPEDEGQA